jgi:hypothetical protein
MFPTPGDRLSEGPMNDKRGQTPDYLIALAIIVALLIFS